MEQKLGELSGYISSHSQPQTCAVDVGPELLEREIQVFEQFDQQFRAEKNQAFKEFQQ